MKLSSWGRYPISDSTECRPRNNAALAAALAQTLHTQSADSSCIARGMGRSYGDSALAPWVHTTTALDHFISFDENEGLLRCAAGTTLENILRVMMPRGWFLPVVPGTWHVSVGGAIASDVHGKNHHLDGSFSQHVESLRLMLASGEIQQCSAQENPHLFHATCAGMGLTGVITDATLRLRRVHSSAILQRTLRASNLDDVFALFEAHHDTRYSVAWLDCLARGSALGRSLLYLGEHADDEGFSPIGNSRVSVPFTTPAFLLNRYSMSLFNSAYYHKPIRNALEQRIEAKQYFFPLDSIQHWNRLYGKRGFLQYQCVIPDATALPAMREILTRISDAGKGSFLSVLKKLGPANHNLLSFPLAGYTLALDFKFEPAILPLLDALDHIVLEHGGRLYLAKDARMSQDMFRRSYPRWEEMAQIRAQTGADRLFHSLQSRRLGL